jgi:HAE1 family hydrophobic/amphiphilic exporter-1
VTPINSFGGLGGRRGAATLQYVMNGPDFKVLQEASQKPVAEMKKIPGVVEPDTNLVLGAPELNVEIDRALAEQLGVNPADVAGALRYLVGGDKVTDYNEGGEQYEVHVRAAQQFRADAEGLALLSVPSSTLGSVPINQIVKFSRAPGPPRLNV